MKLKTFAIVEYRQLKNVSFHLDNGITIVAGANNSGKTSLVELFSKVFEEKNHFSGDDFPADECKAWSDKVFDIAKNIFAEQKERDAFAERFIESVLNTEDTSKLCVISPISIFIQVGYDENDNFKYFSEYLPLELDEKSFFFAYKYQISKELYKENIIIDFDKIKSRLDTSEDDEAYVQSVKDLLLRAYLKSHKEYVYWTDKDYQYQEVNSIDIKTFKRLFNYSNIMASRYLDDIAHDRSGLLSKRIIEIASEDDDWNTLIRSLPDQIKKPIERAGISGKVRKTSLDTLGSTIDSISKTSGRHSGKLVIDMTVTEESIQTFLEDITSARYQLDDCFLKESSQGLGYSNLIYMHLQLEKYRKSIDPLRVNVFIIEEPEAHMHPQMQGVFTRYLFSYYEKHKEMQGIVTTHSGEVVRAGHIGQLRILRYKGPFMCKLYDLHEFKIGLGNIEKGIHKTEDDNEIGIEEFYDWLFTINFSDIVFADKAIFYEGDTERML